MIILNSNFKKYVDSHPDLQNISDRKLKKITRESLKEILVFWFNYIFPKRFTSLQYTLYPNVFRKRKKRNGVRMVDTGEFSERITRNMPVIRGTYKGASMKLLFGRPSGSGANLSYFSQESKKPIKSMDINVRKRIFGFMRGKKIKFEEARKILVDMKAKTSVYSAKTKKLFKVGLVAINKKDEELMQKKLDEIITSKLQRRK